ncbi:T4SS effector SidA family protein [Legionella sainthelensi]|uniref:T4SS effector SidA family protein n=1 Tax=Legionella sainthelensi TaxID=28087 RepID=UPI000E1FBB4F|nr:T4SS effector SidA family protein [Legionella sainthelensi]
MFSQFENNLTEDMKKIKSKIKELDSKTKLPIQVRIYKKNNRIKNVINGAINIFNVIADALKSSKSIGIIGFAINMLATIPSSIAIITNPNKTIREKSKALMNLIAITSISIVAFIVGVKMAAIFAIVASTITLIFKSKEFINCILNKCQQSPPHQESQRAELARNAVELQHMIKRGINAQSNQEILDKIIHILGDELKAIKNNPNSSAYKLKKRNKKMEQLSTLAYQPNLQAQDIEQIKLLQKEIIILDKEIESISHSAEIHHLKVLQSNENLARSYSTFALSVAGVVFATLGLLLVGVTVSPILTPIMLSISIGIATFNLLKWTVEKYAYFKDITKTYQNEEYQKEDILNEALINKTKPMNSYSNIMKSIPAPSHHPTMNQNIPSQGSGVFKKLSTSTTSKAMVCKHDVNPLKSK